MQMVNAGFPDRTGYGFEMVDVALLALFEEKSPSMENLRRIQSIDFFANFSRFNFNANTCDLSTAVSQGPIARTSATEP
jgi:hypothetical protein